MKPGDLVDRYRIVAKLGEGGFGDVYAAEQIDPIRREIALKVMRHDPSTRGMLGRFESEQQALALMAHRHIAEFYDAGVSEQGLPYFVMELVQGSTLSEYCDSERLGVRERLEIFLQVCEAVEHAHQKGIIHRDLKPSNILVRREGDEAVVKVIDFGIAKALSHPLTDRTKYTQAGRPIGTPAYMSPEQVAGAKDIDVRTDIYALGVILYELLTGFVPLDLPVVGYEQIVRDKEPARPSSRLSKLRGDSRESASIAEQRGTPTSVLARSIRGDLDLIVMSCLEKERQRRYGYTKELADEVRRYLEHRPLQSRRPRLAYRARKFVRRHQTGVMFAAAAVIFLALAGVNFYQSRMAGARVQAYKDRDRAVELFEMARAEALFNQDKAIELLAEAVERAPEYQPAKVRYCLELARRGGSGDLDAARAVADVGASASGESSESRGIDAVLSILDYWDDYEGAVRALERLDLRPHVIHYALSFVAEDPATRVELLTVAVESNPWDFDLLWARAVACYHAGDFEQMEVDVERLKKRDLDSPYVLILEGALREKLGDAEGAIASQQEALERFDRSDAEAGWEVYYNQAYSKRGQGDLEGALRDCLHALDLCEDPPFRLQFEALRCEIGLGMLEDARRRVAGIDVSNDPDLAGSQSMQLAWACVKLEMFGEAVELYRSTGEVNRMIAALDQWTWAALMNDDCGGARERVETAGNVLGGEGVHPAVVDKFRYTRGLVAWYCDGELGQALEDLAHCARHRSPWEFLLTWELRRTMEDPEADEEIYLGLNAVSEIMRELEEARGRDDLDDEERAAVSNQIEDWTHFRHFAGMLVGDEESQLVVEEIARDRELAYHAEANFYLGLRVNAMDGPDAARSFMIRANEEDPDQLPVLWVRKFARFRGSEATPRPGRDHPQAAGR